LDITNTLLEKVWQNFTFKKSASATGYGKNTLLEKVRQKLTFNKSAIASITGCASASVTGWQRDVQVQV